MDNAIGKIRKLSEPKNKMEETIKTKAQKKKKKKLGKRNRTSVTCGKILCIIEAPKEKRERAGKNMCKELITKIF